MRNMERGFRKNLFQTVTMGCFFVAFVVLCAIPVVRAKAETADTRDAEKNIRVGYFEQCGFIEETEEGYTGYAVDYLEEIASYTNWKYEYVEESLENCLELLKEGKVDLLCGVQYTEERAESYLYTHIPLGYEYTTVYVKESKEIYYEDYEALEGAKIGVLSGSFHTEAFDRIAKEEGLNYQAEYFSNENEMLDALKAGIVDAVVMGSIHLHDGVKVIGRYNVNPFYFITNVGNKDIMEQIDAAMQAIKMEAPWFEAELTEQYYGNNLVSDGPLLTREEVLYVQSAEPVQIKLMQGSIPLSYMDGEEPAGVFVRYLQLMEEYSGLTFDIEMAVTPMTMEEQTEHILEEDYLMLRAIRAIEKNPLSAGMVSTEPILETKLSYVVRKAAMSQIGTTLKEYTLAVTNEMTYIEELLNKSNVKHRIKYYVDTEECLQAVLDGDADIAIQDSYVIAYILQKPKYEQSLAEYPGKEFKNGMCLVLSQKDPMLLKILNKTIQYISEAETESLVTKEILMNPYQLTFGDFVYQNMEAMILIVGGIAITIVLYFIMQRRVTNLKIRKKEYEILQKKVQEDELTGVYNRPYFYEKAREMIMNSREEMCIVLVDISNFKVVNDLYGMRIGDRLLRQMAKELQRLGEGRRMIVSRFTGDHFYLCLPKKSFESIEFPKKFKTFLDDMEIKVTYGVFVVTPELKNVPVNIMCDRASIAAHDKGQMQVDYIRYYSEEERKRIIQEQEIENDMEKALEQRQFCVFVQPKYDVETEEIIGGEALVRWKHPQKGMIPPGEFISVFEKNGFIVRLDYYVWEETCRMLSEMKEQGIFAGPISINVSRTHFYGKELRSKLEELLEKYHLKPEDLEIEITETICAEDTDIIYKKIKSLREKGFQVAMDDFGSGYSSLNMLKEMPLDIIKMDLKFLDAKENVEKSRMILKTLITLCQSIHLKVVVEGVETKEQQDFLKEIGNCHAQGYYFSKPVDRDTYMQMAENSLRK